jgi:membrane-associated phospholipid phosphatase
MTKKRFVVICSAFWSGTLQNEIAVEDKLSGEKMKSQTLLESLIRRNEYLKYGDELIELHGANVTIARIISRLTPAPLINLYLGVIFSLFSPIGLGPILSPTASLLFCVALMVILPIMPIIIEAARGNIDLDVSQRESRTKFFLFSLLCYAISYVLYTIMGCVIMSSLAAAYFTVTLGVAITSLKYKVSVHGAGVGGPGMALIIVFGLYALLVVFVWIVVIWARVVLRQHSIHQSIAGVLIGIFITIVTFPLVYIS